MIDYCAEATDGMQTEFVCQILYCYQLKQSLL